MCSHRHANPVSPGALSACSLPPQLILSQYWLKPRGDGLCAGYGGSLKVQSVSFWFTLSQVAP